MRNNILFDLDGTLTDPSEGITNSVSHALSRFGIKENDREKLKRFIGPPLVDSFMEYYSFSEDDAYTALGFFREYFSDKGIFENKLYPGIPEMLDALKRNGKKILLATSKPEEFAEKILRHFEIYRFFDFVGGAEMNEKGRFRKDDVINYTLVKGNAVPGDSVMVGDRKYDIAGGKKYGLYTVGVLYGFGSAEEFAEAGADEVCSDVHSLKEGLLAL